MLKILSCDLLQKLLKILSYSVVLGVPPKTKIYLQIIVEICSIFQTKMKKYKQICLDQDRMVSSLIGWQTLNYLKSFLNMGSILEMVKSSMCKQEQG